MGECTTDFDCPGTKVCYNTSWTSYKSECLCSTWYGFSGIDCSEYFSTSTSQFRYVTSIGFSLLWSLLFLKTVFDLKRLIKHKRHQWTVTHTCLFQILITTIFSLSADIVDLLSDSRTQNSTSSIEDGILIKVSPYFYSANILNTLSDCTIFLALATLPFHWREIANQAFRPNQKKLGYVKRLVFFEISFSITILTLTAIGEPNTAFIVSIPFILIVVLAYGIGGTALWRVLVKVAATNTEGEQKTRFLRSAKSVATTSLKIFFAGVIIIILNLAFALMSTVTMWKELSPPNALSVPVLFSVLVGLAFISVAYFGEVYLSTTISASIAHADSITREYGDSGQNKLDNNRSGNISPGQSSPPSVSEFSAHPDSIVGYENVQDVKKKKKFLNREKEPRLKPIIDVSYHEASSTTDITTNFY